MSSSRTRPHFDRRSFAAIATSAVAVAALLPAACHKTPRASRETTTLTRGQYKDANLIIVSLGNVGAEHMSLYGYHRVTTPRLTEWAENAVVFKNAFAHASWTLPGATSFFTATFPYTHRVVGRVDNNTLHPSLKTLAEILKDAGYVTGAFTGGLDHFKGFGHMRGFDVTSDNPNFTSFATTIPQAEEWIAKTGGARFFAFVHGYDAHCPFDPKRFDGTFSSTAGKTITVDRTRCVRGFKRTADGEDPARPRYEFLYAGSNPRFNLKPGEPPPPIRPLVKVVLTQDDVDYLEASYDEEVLDVDRMVTEFLNGLDEAVLRNTIVLIFCEHGEMFAKHGGFGRAGTTRGTLYDDVVHVPLILKTPDGRTGQPAGLVELVDVMPTLLDLLGLPTPTSADGKSLLPLIKDGVEVNDYVYAGLPFNVRQAPTSEFQPYGAQSTNESIRNHHWKLIHELVLKPGADPAAEMQRQETWELYHLDTDPDEMKDVYASEPAEAADLKNRLERWVRWSKSRAPEREADAVIPGELIDDARRFGYH